MCVLSIKVPIQKKSGNLFNDPLSSKHKKGKVCDAFLAFCAFVGLHERVFERNFHKATRKADSSSHVGQPGKHSSNRVSGISTRKMHQSKTPPLSQTIWPRWASRQFFTLPIVETLLPVSFGYSLSSEAVVMRQLRKWKRLWRRSLTRLHKRTSMGRSRSCLNAKTSALQPEDITSKSLEIYLMILVALSARREKFVMLSWHSVHLSANTSVYSSEISTKPQGTLTHHLTWANPAF